MGYWTKGVFMEIFFIFTSPISQAKSGYSEQNLYVCGCVLKKAERVNVLSLHAQKKMFQVQ